MKNFSNRKFKTSNSMNNFIWIFFMIFFSSNYLITVNSSKIKENEIKDGFKSLDSFTELNSKITKRKDIMNKLMPKLKCSKENCIFGECSSDNICSCNRGVITISVEDTILKPNNKNLRRFRIINGSKPIQFCNYQLKDHYKFFLIEALLIFGFGHIYAGRLLIGLLKCFGFVFLLTIDYFTKKSLKREKQKLSHRYFFVSFILYILLATFHLYDIAMIGMNKYVDGKGFKFYEY